MLPYRLLAVDIDGTLVNSHDELTPATCAALTRAAEAGIHVVLATGRRYGRVLHLVEPLGIRVPLVTASGALVKDPADHRTIFLAEFERATLCQALAVIRRRGYEPVLNGDTFREGFEFYCGSLETDSAELTEYLEVNAGRGRAWPGLVDDPPSGVFAGFTIGSHDEMLELESALHREMPGALSIHVLRSPRYVGFLCEFSPAGVTKWSAIEHLAGQRDIGEEAICAVGDDVNDIAMIRAAGLGVAMGNALPSVKEAADRIAPCQHEDGLVHVVEWLLAEVEG